MQLISWERRDFFSKCKLCEEKYMSCWAGVPSVCAPHPRPQSATAPRGAGDCCVWVTHSTGSWIKVVSRFKITSSSYCNVNWAVRVYFWFHSGFLVQHCCCCQIWAGSQLYTKLNRKFWLKEVLGLGLPGLSSSWSILSSRDYFTGWAGGWACSGRSFTSV